MFVATRYATKIRSSSNVCRYSICDSSRGRVLYALFFNRESQIIGSILLKLSIVSYQSTKIVHRTTKSTKL